MTLRKSSPFFLHTITLLNLKTARSSAAPSRSSARCPGAARARAGSASATRTGRRTSTAATPASRASTMSSSPTTKCFGRDRFRFDGGVGELSPDKRFANLDASHDPCSHIVPPKSRSIFQPAPSTVRTKTARERARKPAPRRATVLVLSACGDELRRGLGGLA